MADVTTASISHLHQPQTKRPMSAAERARRYRERQRAATMAAALPALVETPATELPLLKSPDNGLAQRDLATAASPIVTFAPVTPSRFQPAPVLLQLTALGLAAVGITMNGWFARSLGSTDAAGCLFLAIGVAADAAALCLPSVAGGLWQARQRLSALAGWLVWAMTFAFALMAGVGFAAVNISDVTQARSSRVTPAIVTAQTALNDAMAARDRECKGGVGKWCREREAAVAAARDNLMRATTLGSEQADPQSTAAIGLAAWLSGGSIKPTEHDFAMLRLVLLALLPQIGGILLMVGRARQ